MPYGKIKKKHSGEMTMYRPEYPRPSFVRENWRNLNGQWDFEIDDKKNYLADDTAYADKIEVPFCPFVIDVIHIFLFSVVVELLLN